MLNNFLEKYDANLRQIAIENDLSCDYVKKRCVLLLPFYSSEELDNNSDKVLADLGVKIKQYSSRFKKTYTHLYPRTGLEELDRCLSPKIVGGNEIVISSEVGELVVFFKNVDPDIGKLIQDDLHYINNARNDTKYHFGLFLKDSSVPFAYASLSICKRKYQVSALEKCVNRNFSPDSVFVMTRAFCFDGSPKNSMSKLFQQIQKFLKCCEPDCLAIVTAVNPAMGFDGGIFAGSDYHAYARSPMEYWYDHNGYYVPRSSGVVRQKLSTEPIIWLATGQKKYVARSIRENQGVVNVTKKEYKRG